MGYTTYVFGWASILPFKKTSHFICYFGRIINYLIFITAVRISTC